MKKRIGIVFGGSSVEHEISILSAIQAIHAVDKEKYDLYIIYQTKENSFLVGPNFDKIGTFKNQIIKGYEVTFYSKKGKGYLRGIGCYLPRKYKKPIDIIVPIVHGKGVEDGSLAGYFNILNIPYAGSNVLVSSIIQNKLYTKIALQNKGINLVDYFYFKYSDYKLNQENIIDRCEELLYPLIVKPISLGSSVGIKIANNREELVNAINYCIMYEDEIIVEKKIKNYREFNQAILEDNGSYITSLIEEVMNKNSFLTFDDKYIDTNIQKIIPAKISNNLAEHISNISNIVTNILPINGVARIDYIYDVDTNILYLNEINSIPGSLSYYLFEDFLPFPELLKTIVETGIRNHYLKSLKLNSFKSNVLNTTSIFKK